MDPDAILLGGQVGRLGVLKNEGLEEVKAHIHNNEIRTQFLQPMLGASSAVLGAALISGQISVVQ